MYIISCKNSRALCLPAVQQCQQKMNSRDHDGWNQGRQTLHASPSGLPGCENLQLAGVS